MQELMEKLIFALIYGENVAKKIAEIALEGYYIQFQTIKEDASKFRLSIYKYDDMGTKENVSYLIDTQVLLESR